MSDSQNELEALCERAPLILGNLFVRMGLVQAGQAVQTDSVLSSMFEQATSFYRSGRYQEALQSFRSVEHDAEVLRPGLGRTARLNAAACAAAEGQHHQVVDLLEPIYVRGRLFGFPLWNLSLAYYQLRDVSKALKALEAWIDRAPPQYQCRGLLVLSALLSVQGNRDRARDGLRRALDLDRRWVTTQIGVEQTGIGPARTRVGGDVPFTMPRITRLMPQVLNELLRLLEPRRPERSPILKSFLSPEEVDDFVSAVELMAEGGCQLAFGRLSTLRHRHPTLPFLAEAWAACNLFAGRAEESRDTLLRMVESGARPSGSGMWNLACTQLRLGDIAGTLKALQACAETEYRTKGELWRAMSLIAGGGPASQGQSVQPTVQGTIGPQITAGLPSSTRDRRIELLKRLLGPKRIQKAYRPDLIRLPVRERRTVDRILDEARSLEPMSALNMLQPLTVQHPDLYTLKIHAAAYALQAGHLQAAEQHLLEAQGIRILDTNSRQNLAYLYLSRGDYTALTKVLEGGQNSTLADTYTFWLALALARAVSGYGDASIAAAHALTQAKQPPANRIAEELLRAAAIEPSSSTPKDDPAILAAREVRACLDAGDPKAASSRLAALLGENLTCVPEIGAGVFEPQLEWISERGLSSEAKRRVNQARDYYKNNEFTEAAARFSQLYESYRHVGLATNAAAAYMNDNQPNKAAAVLKGALRKSRRRGPKVWRLLYNLALARRALGDGRSALRVLDERIRALVPLRVALYHQYCLDSGAKPHLLDSLDRLKQIAIQPSDELTLALAWAHLTQDEPDVEAAKAAIAQVLTGQALVPPTDVRTAGQVRQIYETLGSRIASAELTSYLQSIAEAKRRQRESAEADRMTKLQLEVNIGVEFGARLCLAKHYADQGERELAIVSADDCESLLESYSATLPRGILAIDWGELGRVAHEKIRLPWFALRCCENGRTADPERAEFSALESEICLSLNPVVPERLTLALERVATGATAQLAERVPGIEAVFAQVRQCDLIYTNCPLLADALERLFQWAIEPADDDTELEDLCERTSILSRVELPAEAGQHMDRILSWILSTCGKEPCPVEVDVHGERIWPRDDEREACCLLAVNSARDFDWVSISDRDSQSEIWQGCLRKGETRYIRWFVERDDGFLSDQTVDLALALKVKANGTLREHQVRINTFVASSDPVWPSYPAGALVPADVPGRQLYGREDFIRRVVDAFRLPRPQSLFFIEAPRQMGKTSVLHFVRARVPEAVLPVYINMELPWAGNEPDNPWNFVAWHLLRQTADSLCPELIGRSFNDVVQSAREVCQKTGKKYVLLLMDEFHALLERARDPKSVLAVFREWLNSPDNQIGMVLADRYSEAELRQRFPGEAWAQFTVKELGPLDLTSARRAVLTPAEESDVEFIPEAIVTIHNWTQGYPYHLQNLLQAILEQLRCGPWITVLPEDADKGVAQLLDQDKLFTEGLCRPERMDQRLQSVIAALLDWRELQGLFQTIKATADWPEGSAAQWQEAVEGWAPRVRDLVAALEDGESLLGRLVKIGVLAKDDGDYRFFSPLLERWLLKMREQGRPLHADQRSGAWLMPLGCAAELTGAEWQSLDVGLVRSCADARLSLPLKERAHTEAEYERISQRVSDQGGFRNFLCDFFEVFIDGREDPKAMCRYPWLTLAYHQARQVRNYWIHGRRTRAAVFAWDQVCSRAVGRPCNSYTPQLPQEWHAVRQMMLQTFQLGLRNAAALTRVISTRGRGCSVGSGMD